MLLVNHTLMKHHDTHWWCKIKTEQTLLLHIKNVIIGGVERCKKNPLLRHDSFCLSHSAHVGLKYSCSVLLQCLKHLADRYSVRQEKKQKGKKHLSNASFFLPKILFIAFYNIWHSTNSWCFYKINL